MPKTRRRAGFSLLELLVAMSIFTLIGVGLVTLLARTSEFTRAGTSKTETLDALQTFTETFDRDVAGLYTTPASETGTPDVRLYSDVASADVDGDGRKDVPIRRLMFVRLIEQEATSPATREAGTTVGAEEYLDLDRDAEEAAAGKLRATGGLMEVFWTAVPESADDLAVMTLYRACRSPIGPPPPVPAPGVPGGVVDPAATPSLLPVRSGNDLTAAGMPERGPLDLPEIRSVARPVLAGVLHFGVEFWGRKTETWDPAEPPPKGPLLVWDSSRGILAKGKGVEGFFLAQGPDSLDDPGDDTFPRRIRVTVVVEEVGRGAVRGRLFSELAPDSKTVELYDASFLPANDTTRRYIKIGAEWIAFDNVDGNRLTGCSRGVRGTVAGAHSQGAVVHYGRTVVKEYAVATFRDAYRDELPALTGR